MRYHDVQSKRFPPITVALPLVKTAPMRCKYVKCFLGLHSVSDFLLHGVGTVIIIYESRFI